MSESEHYFSTQPTSSHERQTFEIELRERLFTFVTDAGVFSKKGIDFGSKLMIQTLKLPPDAHVLDMGCGYGPIGLSIASLLSRGNVTMVDVNLRAVELALENAKINHLTNVEILQSNLFEKLSGRSFTHIVTNPPIRAGKEVVHQIFTEAANFLESKGELWVVMQKKQGAPSAFAKLETLFPQVEEISKDKGYRIIRAVHS